MNASGIFAAALPPAVKALVGWSLLHFVWREPRSRWRCRSFFSPLARRRRRFDIWRDAALGLMCVTAVATFFWHLDAHRAGTAESAVVARLDFAAGAANSVPIRPVRARADIARTDGPFHQHAEPVAGLSARVEDVLPALARGAVSSGHLNSLAEAAAWCGRRIETWLPSIVGIWALGVVFFSLRFLAGWRTVPHFGEPQPMPPMPRGSRGFRDSRSGWGFPSRCGSYPRRRPSCRWSSARSSQSSSCRPPCSRA